MPVHAFVFPGQGSQAPGMGRDLAAAFSAAREVFGEVDDALGEKLSKLMFSGSAEELTLTHNAQPALMAVSVAVARVLEAEGGVRLADRAVLVAGHSLGEYSALAAAGSLPLAEAARLLRLRGLAMQKAVPAGEGGMAALLGVELDLAREICEAAAPVPVAPVPVASMPAAGNETAARRETIEIANDNGGGQIVISGAAGAVARAIEIAKARGVKRALPLPVSAPFHCSLMRPAADAMAEALDRAPIVAPAVPLVSNVSAAKVTDPDRIRALLVDQVTGTVRWRESVQYMTTLGVDSFDELGAGKVLAGLVRRIAPDAAARSAGTPDEIEAMLRAF